MTIKPRPQREPKPRPPRGGSGVSLVAIEGIGEVFAEKLKAAGAVSLASLLEIGATRDGRQKLGKKTGINPQLILEWVNRADLFRIKGVGEEYSDLLEAAGVDTVVELSQRNPGNLHKQLLLANQERKLVRKLPAQTQVADWVEQAKQLPRKIEY
jgi:predicted flap endonuclease-1-like 5' DNA nuclease